MSMSLRTAFSTRVTIANRCRIVNRCHFCYMKANFNKLITENFITFLNLRIIKFAMKNNICHKYLLTEERDKPMK